MENTDAEDKNLTYEQLRAKKIARNKALLESLGLGAKGGLIKLAPKPPAKSAPNSGKKKSKVVKKNDNNEENGDAAESDAENTTDQNEGSIRRSSRLAGQDPVKYDLIEPRGVRYRVDDDAGPTRKKQKTANKSPRPRPTGPKNKENVFGAIPGIPVGTTWEMRMDCSHDGVHRPPVAGIHGNEGLGCYSLALSGGYEDDVDLGHSFTYTGEGGRDLRGTADQPKNLRTAPQSKDQTLTRGNAALALNCDNGKPVRVIRGFKLDSPYAPASGYRYDGLYDVKKYWSETGLSGFLVWKFALVRCPDQESAPWEEDESENNNNNSNDDNSDTNNNVDNNENQEESASEVIQTKKEEEKKEPEKLGLCISL